EILGYGKGYGKPALRIAPERRDLEGGRRVLAAVIFPLPHFPATSYGAPDELEFRVGRQPFCRDLHWSARRTMLGRHHHPPDKAVRRGERRLAAELHSCRSRPQHCDGEENSA